MKSRLKLTAVICLIIFLIVGAIAAVSIVKSRNEAEFAAERENNFLDIAYPDGDAKLKNFTVDVSDATVVEVRTSAFGSPFTHSFAPDDDEFSWICEMLSGDYSYAGRILNDSSGGATSITFKSGEDTLYTLSFSGFYDKIMYEGYYYTKDGGGLDSNGLLEIMSAYR